MSGLCGRWAREREGESEEVHIRAKESHIGSYEVYRRNSHASEDEGNVFGISNIARQILVITRD